MLPHDRPARRPATSTDRTAATMKERDTNLVRGGARNQLILRAVERPATCEIAALLVGIRISEHHFDLISTRRHLCAKAYVTHQLIENRARLGERRGRLHEWDQVDFWCSRERASGLRRGDAWICRPGEEGEERLEILNSFKPADHVVGKRRPPMYALQLRSNANRCNHFAKRDVWHDL